jgi:integrase
MWAETTTVGTIVGWRKGSLQSLRWADVDRAGRRVHLRRASSKNAKPYVIILAAELAAIIGRRWAMRFEHGESFRPEIILAPAHVRSRVISSRASASHAARCVACQGVASPRALRRRSAQYDHRDDRRRQRKQHRGSEHEGGVCRKRHWVQSLRN